MNTDPGNWLNVFIERNYTCDIMVDTLDFYAVRSGDFFISFWRKVPSTPHSYQMVRKVRVSVDTPGKDTMRLNEQARMMVRNGYVLGIHYSGNANKGVVSYEQSTNRRPTEGIPRSILQNFISSDLFDGKLKENQIISNTLYTTTKRAMALSVNGQPIQIIGEDTQPRREVDQANGHVYIPNFKQTVQMDGFLTRFEFLAEADRDNKVQLSVWRRHNTYRLTLYKLYVVSWSKGPTRVIRFTPEKALKVKQGDRIGLGFYSKSPLPFDKVNTTCENGETYFLLDGSVETLEEGSHYFFNRIEQEWGSCRRYSLQAAIVDEIAPDYNANNADLDGANGQLKSDLSNKKRSLFLRENSTVRRGFSFKRGIMSTIYAILRNNNEVDYQSDKQENHGRNKNYNWQA